MAPKIPIAIFASGRGSNFDSILASIQREDLPAEIVAVVSDQPGAKVLAKAEAAGIRTKVFPFPLSSLGGSLADRRRQHEEKILNELSPLAPEFIIMAGYMRIITPYFIEAFRCERGYSKIVNIHPSLLPSFRGVHA